MSQTNRSDVPLFQVRNHHSASRGLSPHIDAVGSHQYLGYFENQHGEQVVFIYHHDSHKAVLYLGDAGWETPHAVVDGAVPDRSSRTLSGCGSARAGKLRIARRVAKMIDNPGTVARLMEQMKEHLPIPAFPSKEIVRTLRRGGAKLSIDRALAVKHVFYAGDEAGIVCDVTPARDAKTVILVSLTHLRIASDHPLSAPILAYQVARVRRLAGAEHAP